MSTPTLPRATAAATGAGRRQACCSACLRRAPVGQSDQIRPDLGRQSDARLAATLGAAEIAALRQGRLQLPSHTATSTSA